MKHVRIVVAGSINKDIIMKVERHPKPGETISASEIAGAFGGKGANQAVAAARLGAAVTLIGAVGKDPAGDEQLNHFTAEGIDVSSVLRVSEPSGAAYITVDRSGENSIILYPGANYEVIPEWVEQHSRIIEQADVLMLQMEIPVEASLAAARIAAAAGTFIIFNPAPVHPVPEELYQLIDLLTPNESELSLLAGTDDFEAAVRILLGKGVGAVLATLGAAGSRYVSAKEQFTMPTYQQVEVTDTTAAGDSFNAAVAVQMAEGRSVREAAAFASAAASLTVSRFGAQPSLPRQDEVEQFIEQYT